MNLLAVFFSITYFRQNMLSVQDLPTLNPLFHIASLYLTPKFLANYLNPSCTLFYVLRKYIPFSTNLTGLIQDVCSKIDDVDWWCCSTCGIIFQFHLSRVQRILWSTHSTIFESLFLAIYRSFHILYSNVDLSFFYVNMFAQLFYIQIFSPLIISCFLVMTYLLFMWYCWNWRYFPFVVFFMNFHVSLFRLPPI